jgi:hypothetical protein
MITLAVAMVLSAAIGRAHDPYESWASVIVANDALELNVTMARSTALQLADPEKKIRDLSAEKFPLHRAQFERAAGALFVLTVRRAALSPRKIAVELTEENDVAFKITYARPAAGRLHFHAAFLAKLGQGYGGIIEVSDHDGHNLGWERFSIENPNLEVTVPAPLARGSKKP